MKYHPPRVPGAAPPAPRLFSCTRPLQRMKCSLTSASQPNPDSRLLATGRAIHPMAEMFKWRIIQLIMVIYHQRSCALMSRTGHISSHNTNTSPTCFPCVQTQPAKTPPSLSNKERDPVRPSTITLVFTCFRHRGHCLSFRATELSSCWFSLFALCSVHTSPTVVLRIPGAVLLRFLEK